GTIYIEEYLTPKRIAQNSQQSPRQKLMSYWGYKFESLSTLPTNIPPSQLSPEQMKTYLAERKSSVVNTNIQYCSVVKTKLGKHGIIVGAEVDCVEESKSTDKKRSDCYVELKTNKMIMSDRDERNFERFKMLRIWAQSFLAGIPKIVVGFRDPHGNVKSVQEFKTLELPRLVRGKPDMWDPTVCLNFAHDFLTFLRQVITESSYQVIEGNPQRQKVEYTISYNPAEGNHISVKKIMKPLEISADTEKERSSNNEQEDKKLIQERGEGVLPIWFRDYLHAVQK
ncbi:RAI1 like PD-XK nuclease-domain-containing protein, partial [Paraphysoderma sedebokerense]